MAGNATRLPDETIKDIPKQLIPLPYDQTPLGLAIRPFYRAYNDDVQIGCVIPSGTDQRNKWGNYLLRHLPSFPMVLQNTPNGTFGAVHRYFLDFPDRLVNPTYVIYPDTIADIDGITILNMSQSHTNWMTLSPKTWEGGDRANVSGYAISGIEKEQNASGYSPSGLLYFHNTIELFGILSALMIVKKEINLIDVVNKYCSFTQIVGCFIDHAIDCGDSIGYSEAKQLGIDTQGRYYG
jgi:hypothetical protein